jgi:hypothetical protein
MLKLSRSKHIAPYSTFKIFIDGSYQGDIKAGEIKEFFTSKGCHTVCIKMKFSWFSYKYKFFVNDENEVINLKICTLWWLNFSIGFICVIVGAKFRDISLLWCCVIIFFITFSLHYVFRALFFQRIQD